MMSLSFDLMQMWKEVFFFFFKWHPSMLFYSFPSPPCVDTAVTGRENLGHDRVPLCFVLGGQIASESWQVCKSLCIEHQQEIMRENSEAQSEMGRKKNSGSSLSSNSGPLVNFICEWLGVNDSDSFLIVSSTVSLPCDSCLSCDYLAARQSLFGPQSCKLPLASWRTCAVAVGPGCLIQVLVTVRSIYAVQ